MPRTIFDSERCKGCQLCINFCPNKVLVVSKKINKRGTAVLVVTHNYDLVKKANERIIKLDDGRALKAVIKQKVET